ncbi:hypothetical protein GQ42DRAFT_159801 [Ramicandelaber brevisporus]|nr:hypothetical protein GQ42DRAFT_159801 [Ramicandelaber brevisporus]
MAASSQAQALFPRCPQVLACAGAVFGPVWWLSSAARLVWLASGFSQRHVPSVHSPLLVRPSSVGFLPHLLHHTPVFPAVVVPRRCQVGGCCGFSTCSSCWCCCHGYVFSFGCCSFGCLVHFGSFVFGSYHLHGYRLAALHGINETLDTLVFPTLCCLADSP